MEHVDVLLFLVTGSPKEGIIGAGDTVAGEISVSVSGGDWHCKGSGSVTVTARGFGTPKFPTFSFTNLTLVGDDSPSGIDLDRVGGGGISWVETRIGRSDSTCSDFESLFISGNKEGISWFKKSSHSASSNSIASNMVVSGIYNWKEWSAEWREGVRRRPKIMRLRRSGVKGRHSFSLPWRWSKRRICFLVLAQAAVLLAYFLPRYQIAYLHIFVGCAWERILSVPFHYCAVLSCIFRRPKFSVSSSHMWICSTFRLCLHIVLVP